MEIKIIISLFLVFIIINVTPAAAVSISSINQDLDKINQIASDDSNIHKLSNLKIESWWEIYLFFYNIWWDPQTIINMFEESSKESIELLKVANDIKDEAERMEIENVSAVDESQKSLTDVLKVQKRLNESQLQTNLKNSTQYHLVPDREIVQFNNSNNYIKYWQFKRYKYDEKRNETFIELYNGRNLIEMNETEFGNKFNLCNQSENGKSGYKLSCTAMDSSVPILNKIYNNKKTDLEDITNYGESLTHLADITFWVGIGIAGLGVCIDIIAAACTVLSFIVLPSIATFWGAFLYASLLIFTILSAACGIYLTFAGIGLSVAGKILSDHGNYYIKSVVNEYDDLIHYVR